MSFKIKELWADWADSFNKVSRSPESDFRWIVEAELGISNFHLMTHGENILSPENIQKLQSLLERRASGEPVAYILGSWDFYGREFAVGPGVLVPRPETELIIDIFKDQFKNSQEILKVVDFGAGSGCLAITIALESPNSEVTAVEMSEDAFNYILKNSHHYGFKKQIQKFQSKNMKVEDWVETQDENSVDVVVSNPPYIAKDDERLDTDVRKFEPELALFSADDGYDHLKRWSMLAGKILKPGGLFLCEIGQGQDEVIITFIESLKIFRDVSIKKDLSGISRIIKAIKN